MMASHLVIGENLSSNSIPYTLSYPLQTSITLFRTTFPYSFNLFLNTHFVPIMFLSLGLGKSSFV
jgi:hypothetical protein